MALDVIQRTNLWKKSLAQVDGSDPDSIPRETLRAALISFRKNAESLVSRVHASLPNLTVHDISHLDALWETADLICGENFELTPLEAFIFGGAVLLHDSALCFEAYENGLEGIRSTVQWCDAYAGSSDELEDDKKSYADFVAIRALHADRAGELLNFSWEMPDTEQSVFLLENLNLRRHYGELIGTIAASHHWSIEDVANRLAQQKNAITPFPNTWTIDPIKIACMLRCADASHIDSARAPDFLHALIKREGVSYEHWQAQNKLGQPSIDNEDSTGSTLLYTSTGSYKERDFKAWWVAYDTLCMIDREIKSANALLESRQNSTPFKVKSVKGVESAELMSKFVQTDGWSPCSAEIHVGNIAHLVSNLGGEQLYGKDCKKLDVTLRELIQNARDSIKAREQIEDGFEGIITVRVMENEDALWISVEDNGVGMSKRVLTGPLLDFGTSFWTSSLVNDEFPGLKSSGYKSIGRFGIGFYSVFMGSDNVVVASRNYNEGVKDVSQLIFSDGLSLRPLYKAEAPKGFGSSISTQVKFKVNSVERPNLEKMEVSKGGRIGNSFFVHFKDYIAALVGALDVSVFYSDRNKTEQIHYRDFHNKNLNNWLRQISFSKYQNAIDDDMIAEFASRLSPIYENDKLVALAAMKLIRTPESTFLDLSTVGGLARVVQNRNDDYFVGFFDYEPDSAKRMGSEYSASKESIEEWAMLQKELLLKKKLNVHEILSIANALHYFGIDPIDVAHFLITLSDGNDIVVSMDKLAELAESNELVFLTLMTGDHHTEYHQIKAIEGKINIRVVAHGKFCSLKMDNGKPEDPNAVLGCLVRSIERRGKKAECKLTLNKHDGSFEKIGELVVKAV
jgi:hypothetical protein